mmetsp:Transcript_118550/g.377902  ORF Transcript_118550/g.377902 Transcript_118550/m.377902 type:complete len:550 (-) Transcript_118550:40-1689(-)
MAWPGVPLLGAMQRHRVSSCLILVAWASVLDGASALLIGPAPAPALAWVVPSGLSGDAPGAPSGAPAGPQPIPLIQQARLRLMTDHHSLANASEQLITVQDQIANMEEALFGKVVDSDKVESLYASHEGTEAANAKLKDDIQRLTEQIAGLSLQVAQMQRGYVTDGNAHRKLETELRGQVVQSEATEEGLETELSKGRRVQAVHDSLSTKRKALRDESIRTSTDGMSALKELQELEEAAAVEAARRKELQTELFELHHMGLDCHVHVDKEEKVLVVKEAEVPVEEVAETSAEQHMLASAKAGEQRLAAENIILRQEVLDAEREGAHALIALQASQAKLKALEVSLMAEVLNINQKMNVTKDQAKVVAGSLAENTGVSADDKERKHSSQVRLATIQQQVSPVIYASLNVENDVYAVELEQLLVNVSESKDVEAKAVIAAQQVEAELDAQKIIATETEKALEEATTEGQLQIREATKVTAEKVAASLAVEKQAKDALAATCAPKWLKRQEAKDALVATCRSQRAELAIVSAQRDTLEETLKAQQTAAAVGF